MEILSVVSSMENGRICLSHRELLGTWEENAALFQAGETIAGIVRSVEPYGIFVELTPNLAGLAEPREDVRVGQQAAVYIKSVQPEKLKIKLALIDTQDSTTPPAPLHYFITEGPLTDWRYSPPGCSPGDRDPLSARINERPGAVTVPGLFARRGLVIRAGIWYTVGGCAAAARRQGGA